MDDCRKLPLLKELSVPYYVQIYDIVYDMIQNGELQAGETLPGENMLASYWNVSRSTVRMAVRKLEEDGYIYKMQGKKTTVTDQMSRSKTGLNQISNPCYTSCIDTITRVESKVSIQNGSKLLSDLLGYSRDTFNALALDSRYFVKDVHVASSLMIIPVGALDQAGVSIDDMQAIEKLMLHDLFDRARHSGLSFSVMEWTEDETDKPEGSIMIVMDEVLEEDESPVAYGKYWMDSNWYRFTLERKR